MLGSFAVNAVFPARCPSCNVHVEEHGKLCTECWKRVTFISEPQCTCCGNPFAFPMDAGSLCGECIQELPPFAKARAVFKYDEHTAKFITGFKFHDRTFMGPVLARWMAQSGRELLAEAEVIMPVPLHRRRLWERKFNQSAMLVQHIAKLSHKTAELEGLVRTRYTTPQSELTRKQRLKNVRGAFSVNPKRVAQVQDKNVLLVDDVMTTGSTLKACAKVLLKAGAKQVNVLTAARTVIQ